MAKITLSTIAILLVTVCTQCPADNFMSDTPRQDYQYVFLPSSPSAVKFKADHIFLFYVGSKGALARHLMGRIWDGEKWGNDLNLNGQLSSSPSAVVIENNIHVFYRGLDRHLYRRIVDQNGISGAEDRINANDGSESGDLWSSPSAIVVDSEVHVFYKGKDGHLYRRRIPFGNNKGPEDRIVPDASGGGQGDLSTSPSAILSNGEIHVFYGGTDRAVYRRRLKKTASAGPEDKIGGKLSSGLCAIMISEKMHCYYSGMDGGLYQRIVGKSEEKIGGIPWSTSAVVSSHNQIICYYMGQNRLLFRRIWSGDKWGAEELIGNSLYVDETKKHNQQ
jgi:hypothetical protein